MLEFIKIDWCRPCLSDFLPVPLFSATITFPLVAVEVSPREVMEPLRTTSVDCSRKRAVVERSATTNTTSSAGPTLMLNNTCKTSPESIVLCCLRNI